MELIGLKSGSMLFANSDGFGLIDPTANVRQLQQYGVLDLVTDHAGKRLLQVSADGGVVQVDATEPRHAYRFALADRLLKIDPPADDALKPPITKTPGLEITNIRSRTPTVNGKPIKLKDREQSRNAAVMPGQQRFVLAADYSLRLLDQNGHDVWPSALSVPGTAWHVNVPNQRLIVAAYADGTIRWHRLSDGKELLALFINPDGQRWVLWTPQGYYDASLGADELIG
jgi:hypothetical protein